MKIELLKYMWPAAELLAGFLRKIFRVKEALVGLEVSANALRAVVRVGKELQLHTVPLAPGVVLMGHIANAEEFGKALRALSRELTKEKKQGTISVALSLSPQGVYSQVFQLPILENAELESAVMLNLEMASPLPLKDVYAGWQLLYRDEAQYRLNILSAFVDREIVDGVVHAIKSEGFYPYVTEWRALSLLRFFGDRIPGFSEGEPAICIMADASGVDYLIVQRGALYFEYFHSWQELGTGEGKISMTRFSEAVRQNIIQLMNFYSAHWKGVIRVAYLTKGALTDQIRNTIAEQFSLEVRMIEPNGVLVEPEWYAAVGSALRTRTPLRNDQELTLSGTTPFEEFLRLQVITFLHFWRRAVPLACGLVLAGVGAAYFFANGNAQTLEAKADELTRSGDQAKIQETKAGIGALSRSVELLESVRASRSEPRISVFKRVRAHARKDEIVIHAFTIDAIGRPIRVAGLASSEEHIVNFKAALEGDGFRDVDIPLAQVVRSPEGLAFSVSFLLAPSNAE